MAHLSATIDLIDLSTTLQVDLGIFRPGVHTLTSTIDSAQIAFLFVRPYW